MIAVDTNVLVRLVLNDEAAQAGKARDLFDAHAGEDDGLWIADVVLAELVRALDRSHGRPPADMVGVLRALGRNATVCLESAACLVEATDLYESRAGRLCRLFADGEGAQRRLQCAAHLRNKMRALPGAALL